MDEAAYDALVGRIYDVALDRSALAPMLRLLAAGLESSACTLGVQDLVSHDIERAAVGTPEDMDRACTAYYRFRNPFLGHAARFPVGAVFCAEELLAPEAVRGHEYVNDYLLHYDVPRVMAMKLWQGSRVIATLNVMRSHRQPAFGAAERQMAERLVPHLQRAVALSRSIAWSAGLAQATAGRLATLGTVTMLLDADGRVQGALEDAHALLARSGALRLDGTGLRAADPAQDARLARMVALATRGDATGRRSGGAMTISREAGRPLAVLLAPLGHEAGLSLPGRPAAVASVTDPDAASVPPATRLGALYGLTGSEAAVALQLASGRTLAQAAEALGLTVGSARQYLQRVFGKTQVVRQAELVRLVAALAGAPDDAACAGQGSALDPPGGSASWTSAGD